MLSKKVENLIHRISDQSSQEYLSFDFDNFTFDSHENVYFRAIVRDIFDLEMILHDGVHIDRLTVRCEPIPGEALWINRFLPESNSLKKRKYSLIASNGNISRNFVFVHFYGDFSGALRLNDMVDIIGSVCLDSKHSINDWISESKCSEQCYHLDCTDFDVLSSSYPSIIVGNVPLSCSLFGKSLFQDNFMRNRLIILEKLTRTLGDSLAAEYLLLALFAKEYSRFDNTVVGTINLFLIGEVNSKALQTVLRCFLPRTVEIDISISNMNSKSLLPRRKEDQDFEVSELQCGAGTVMLLTSATTDDDDDAHTLTLEGEKSLKSLLSILSHRDLIVDFSFYDLHYPLDVIPIGILSSWNSFPLDRISSDIDICYVPVDNQASSSSIQASSSEPEEGSNATEDHQIRLWSAYCRDLSPQMSESLMPRIEHDFVDHRLQDADCSPQHLHRWLNLVRSVAKSFGDLEIQEKHWDYMKALEATRLHRLASRPSNECAMK